MCGIIGYIGFREAQDILLEGLRRLEYRGYDSAGLATLGPQGQLCVVKSAGRIDDLARRLANTPSPGTLGIGHTRWATHGPPSPENAHPHLGGGRIALVHNGVIENYQVLKRCLQDQGVVFQSATDTEVVAHLIALALDEESAGNGQVRPAAAADELTALADLIQTTLGQLRGTYGLAMLLRDHPHVLIAARCGSPLVIGVGQDELFLASDAAALAGYTDQIVYLADHELAILTPGQLRLFRRNEGRVPHRIQQLELKAADVELGGHAHFMLKEILEQPESVGNVMRGRLDTDQATAHFGGLNLTARQLRQIRRIVLTGCGTSWHAALVGEYLIEELARIPVEVEYASELRYRNPPLEDHTLLFALTQSGETADTLAALREMKRKGYPTLAICNVVGSTIAREADGGIYLHAGPEIGVASTKVFTSQCVALAMLALHLGRLRHLSYVAGQRVIEQLQLLPDKVAEALDECRAAVCAVAEKYAHCDNFLYLGRQYNFPTALEGALKLKEISYIHAEGYPAAEMKHGPIALVDAHTPSVFLNPHGPMYEKVLANMEEIKARGGPIVAVVTKGDTRVDDLADDVLHIPAVEDYLQPVISVLPLQLLAYHIALLRGCDVDKPRNLAKSVTVE